MRLAAISDMHGNAVAFEAVIDDLKGQSPDAIVCLGDITMRGPQPTECVALLRALNPLALVRGNYDDMFAWFPRPGWQPTTYKHELVLRTFHYTSADLSQADRQWLSELPLEQTLTVEGVQLEMFHATPSSLVDITWPWASLEELCNLRRDEATKLVLFGHIHHAFARQARGRLVVNSGSVGLPFDGDNRASYAIVDIENGGISVQLRRVAYDIESALQIARKRAMPDLDSFEYALRAALYPYSEPVRS